MGDKSIIFLYIFLWSSSLEPLVTGRIHTYFRSKNITLKMSVRVLLPALASKAQSELNEKPESLNADLQLIKDWIEKQSHLNARTDDQWLVAFLRGCKFSLEKAKEKLDLYYTVRSTLPELYGIKHSDAIFEELYSLGAMLLLPKTAGADAPRVTLIRPGRFDAHKFNVLQMMAVSNVLQKIVMMEDDHAVVAGTTIILDLKGVSLTHFFQMTPVTIKKIVVSAQDASPIRMKGIHCLNTPPGFETIYNAMKSLLNEKNQNRLYVHNTNYNELYKYIPKEILPAEYGGNAGTTDGIIAYWKKKVMEYSSFLEDDQKYGTDESRRMRGKPEEKSNTLGIEGSFRQLQVD